MARQGGRGAENDGLSWLDREDGGRKRWIVVVRQEDGGRKRWIVVARHEGLEQKTMDYRGLAGRTGAEGDDLPSLNRCQTLAMPTIIALNVYLV